MATQFSKTDEASVALSSEQTLRTHVHLSGTLRAVFYDGVVGDSVCLDLTADDVRAVVTTLCAYLPPEEGPIHGHAFHED